MPISSTSRLVLLQARSLRTLCWALGTLVLLQFGLRLAIDHLWPELRDPTFEVKARRLRQFLDRAGGQPLTVLAVGSSVTGNAFHARLLEEWLARQTGRKVVAVNMSTQGAGPLTQLIWTNRLIQRRTPVDLLCIEANPLTYCHPGYPEDANRFPAWLLLEEDLDIVQRYSPDTDLRHNWRHHRWVPFYQHRLAMLNYLSPNLVPTRDRMATQGGAVDDRFWAILPPRSPEHLQRSLAQARGWYEKPLQHFTPNQRCLQAFEELLALVQKQRLSAVVVFTPQGPMMRGLFHPPALRAFKQRLAELCHRHGVDFVDAHDWLDEDHFTDSIHPNTIGAERYARRLAEEVLRPWLHQRPGLLQRASLR